jgi:hypothetical protein
VQVKRVLFLLRVTLFVSYLIYEAWHVSSWNDFAADCTAYLQFNGIGHLQQPVTHFLRKWCHCLKRVYNNLKRKPYFFNACCVLKSPSLEDVLHLVKIKNSLRAISGEYGLLLPNNTFFFFCHKVFARELAKLEHL